MLKEKTDKYTHSAVNQHESQHGFYFPDEIIEGFSQVIGNIDLLKPSINSNSYNEPFIDLEYSKKLIINALHDFSPKLGEKASQILNDDKRMNIQIMSSPIEAGQVQMMRCRPAELTMDDLKNRGMDQIPPDLEEAFPMSINPNDYSIIDFQYDNTINSTIYLAHELGHALADDYQREFGNTYRDNPIHMEEIQAYFTQNIVRNSLKAFPDPDIAEAANQHAMNEFSNNIDDLKLSLATESKEIHGRPISLITSAGIINTLENAESTHANRNLYVSQVLFGNYGPQGINKTLAVIGIERTKDLNSFINKAISSIVTPKVEPSLELTALPNAQNQEPAIVKTSLQASL